ncbi:AC4 [Whitefly-associated begomovirus 1]|uniref:AC4 n=1 Tax=Whitefly-associated begomovirus 1 TaxID=2169739 RepID=A0A0N7ISF8_9GEMI|nr:AC4 [Whitefly-associated begomovirus 1]ALK03430.1 AC4 [Whitefly-associated begomovirus 1]ALK03435.1 AC4 [Whitefly-associated begomovirus 1]ALK03440.1 AC4 [Whitefly-associated begomovirus 1]
MGNLTSTCFFNSRGSTTARIRDSSTWYPQTGQHISIRTFRELNPAPTSSPISTKMEMLSNGVNSRSTVDLLEEVNRRLTTPQRRH